MISAEHDKCCKHTRMMQDVRGLSVYDLDALEDLRGLDNLQAVSGDRTADLHSYTGRPEGLR